MKYKNIRYTVTALLFLAVIIFLLLMTIITNYKNENLNNLNKEKIEDLYSDKLYGFNFFIDTWSFVQNLIGTKLFDDAQYGMIIKDSEGKLHFPVKRYDVAADANETAAFADTVKTYGIPFVYIQAPDKMLEDYTSLPKGGYNYSNENCDEFLDLLKAAEIDTFDLREVIKQENRDRSSLFYITDHHWTTKTAFDAFTDVVGFLNDNYNLNIDNSYFYRDIDNYKLTEYKDCYLGSLGRRVGRFGAQLDDYTLIEPDYITDYDIYLTPNDSQPSFVGSFREAILKEHILNSDDIRVNKHASYFEWDYDSLIIKNNTVENGIKLLLVKDSFSLPLAAFLSTCVSELHLIDVRGAEAPVPAVYAGEHGFDAVIVLYNPEVFGADMFKFNQ